MSTLTVYETMYFGSNEGLMRTQLSLVKYEKCPQNASGEITSTFILTSNHPQQPLKRLRQLTATAPSDNMLTITARNSGTRRIPCHRAVVEKPRKNGEHWHRITQQRATRETLSSLYAPPGKSMDQKQLSVWLSVKTMLWKFTDGTLFTRSTNDNFRV